MTELNRHLPAARPGLSLRGIKRAQAREIQDSLTPDELTVREFYRDYIATETKARLGAYAPTTFLQAHTPVWDGGIDPSTGRVYQPFWRDLLVQCREHNADPLEFLVWRQTVWAQGTPMSPADIRVNFAFDQFALRDSGVEFARILLLTMESQLQQLQFKYMQVHRYTTRAAYEAALHAGAAQFSKLFIFCMAVQRGLPDIVSRNLGMAAHEYALNRVVIDQVWGDRIPAEFRSKTSMALLAWAQGRDG